MASIGTYFKYAAPSVAAYLLFSILMALVGAIFPASAAAAYSGTGGIILLYGIPALVFCYAGFRAVSEGGESIIGAEIAGFATGLAAGITGGILIALRVAFGLALNGSLGLLGTELVVIATNFPVELIKMAALGLIAGFAGWVAALALRKGGNPANSA